MFRIDELISLIVQLCKLVLGIDIPTLNYSQAEKFRTRRISSLQILHVETGSSHERGESLYAIGMN
jgi:hypothetical protein